MTLQQVLDIEKALGRNLPVDMYSSMDYYDELKDEWTDILHLDTIPAIRILRASIRKEVE